MHIISIPFIPQIDGLLGEIILSDIQSTLLCHLRVVIPSFYFTFLNCEANITNNTFITIQYTVVRYATRHLLDSFGGASGALLRSHRQRTRWQQERPLPDASLYGSTAHQNHAAYDVFHCGDGQQRYSTSSRIYTARYQRLLAKVGETCLLYHASCVSATRQLRAN